MYSPSLVFLILTLISKWNIGQCVVATTPSPNSVTPSLNSKNHFVKPFLIPASKNTPFSDKLMLSTVLLKRPRSFPKLRWAAWMGGNSNPINGAGNDNFKIHIVGSLGDKLTKVLTEAVNQNLKDYFFDKPSDTRPVTLSLGYVGVRYTNTPNKNSLLADFFPTDESTFSVDYILLTARWTAQFPYFNEHGSIKLIINPVKPISFNFKTEQMNPDQGQRTITSTWTHGLPLSVTVTADNIKNNVQYSEFDILGEVTDNIKEGLANSVNEITRELVDQAMELLRHQ